MTQKNGVKGSAKARLHAKWANELSSMQCVRAQNLGGPITEAMVNNAIGKFKRTADRAEQSVFFCSVSGNIQLNMTLPH